MISMVLIFVGSGLVSPIQEQNNWESAVASYYYLPGNTMANGDRFRNEFITAHKDLPFGTILELSYNGKRVLVEVADRGPYIKGRTLDVSLAVADFLGFVDDGVVRLKKRVVYTPPS